MACGKVMESMTLGVLAVFLLASTAEGTADFTIQDKDTLAVALNLEYFEAEFFLFGAYGLGLDHFAAHLADNGAAPKGGEKADLDPIVRELVEQFGLQEVGHIRHVTSYTTMLIISSDATINHKELSTSIFVHCAISS